MLYESDAIDRDASDSDELFDPPRVITDPDLYCVLEPGSIIHFDHSDTKWKMGPLQTEKSREHDEKYGFVTDSSSVLTPWILDDPDAESFQITSEIIRKIEYLERLTDAGCSGTPRLLDYTIDKQFEGDLYLGGHIVVILMEKVPGQNLDGRFNEFPLEKRNRVRIAEFYRCKLSHLDPSLRNIVWDDESERCFIVDMEDVIETDDQPLELHAFRLQGMDAQLAAP